MDVERWLRLYLAVLSGDPVESVDLNAPLSVHDLDSFDAIQMTLELEKKFGCHVEPELFLETDKSVAEIAETLRSIVAETQARA